MAKRLLVVVAVALVCGIVGGMVWGRTVGAGLGMTVLLIGAIIAVLRRNQEDLHELERGKVAEEVDQALGAKYRPSGDPAADSGWP